MRDLLLRWLFLGLLFVTEASPLPAQPPTQPPQDTSEKSEPDTSQKFKRDETSVVTPYTLAGIALVIVMVLVCKPARRE
jgi:hypothetical protein